MSNFTRSKEIAQLAAALAAAQGEIESAWKDRENPHFRANYATLASVWNACRHPLSANGIAVFQPASVTGKRVTVTTLVTHKSGEWICSELTLEAMQPGPQGIGSTITYGRRYGLSAMVGVAPEDEDDDDGNAAQGNPGPGQLRTPPPPPKSTAAPPAAAKRGDPPPVRAMASPPPGNPPVVAAGATSETGGEKLAGEFIRRMGIASTQAPTEARAEATAIREEIASAKASGKLNDEQLAKLREMWSGLDGEITKRMAAAR